MANIKNHLNNIKNALFGQEVRGSIHDGIDAINKEVESTTGRQVDLEKTFDQLVINAGNSNAEIVGARVKSDGTSYPKLGDRLNEVDSQLEHKASRVNGIYDFEKDFGGVVDNQEIDNSKILIEAFNYIKQNGGGVLNFGCGTFYFLTPINIDSNLNGITLKGVMQYGNSKGTKLKYLGENYFITINSFQFSNIMDITIEGNNINNGIYINTSAFSNFIKVRFDSFTTNFRLYKKSGYVKFVSCSFSACVSTKDCVILGYEGNLVGSSSENNVEYVYFDKCNFEGNGLNSNGLKIYFGQFIYLNEVDICNFNGYGVYAETTSFNHLVNDLFIRSLSSVKNKTHIKINAMKSSINRITIDGHFTQRDNVETQDRFFVIEGNVNGYVSSVDLNAKILNTNKNVMDYGMELSYINGFNFNILGSLGKIRRTVATGNINMNSLKKTYAIQVPTGSNTYSWNLSTNSPFTSSPIILISSMGEQNYSYDIINEFGGNLAITLNFKEALNKHTIFFAYLTDNTF